MVPKSKVDQISLLYSQSSSVQTEKTTKIRLPLEPATKRKKIGIIKSKSLADAVVEEVAFLCGLVGSNVKERTDIKLENMLEERDSGQEAKDC